MKHFFKRFSTLALGVLTAFGVGVGLASSNAFIAKAADPYKGNWEASFTKTPASLTDGSWTKEISGLTWTYTGANSGTSNNRWAWGTNASCTDSNLTTSGFGDSVAKVEIDWFTNKAKTVKFSVTVGTTVITSDTLGTDSAAGSGTEAFTFSTKPKGNITIASSDATGGYGLTRIKINSGDVSEVHVTGVTLDKTTSSIKLGATEQLTETVAPSDATNKKVSWTTSNDKVVTVSTTGLVTAVGEGNANVTVTTEDQAKTAVCAYTVTGFDDTYDYNDNCDRAMTGLDSGKTTYYAWEKKSASNTKHSGAVYAGNSATTNDSIQLRSSNDSGVVSTVSGGIVRKALVVFDSKTQDTNTVEFYGSNTVYTSTGDLYVEAKKGTLLGSAEMGGVTEVTFDTKVNYEYIGVKAGSGACYCKYIVIYWEKVTTPSINIEASKTTVVEGGSATVTATRANSTAAIQFEVNDVAKTPTSVVDDTATLELTNLTAGSYVVKASLEGLSVSKTITINVVVIPTYVRVTSISQLTEGKEVLIVSDRNGNYGKVAAKTYASGTFVSEVATTSTLFSIQPQTDEYAIYTLGVNAGETTTYTFKDANDKYLAATGAASNNYLQAVNDVHNWTISIDARGEFSVVSATNVGEGARNVMQYNASSKRFACYASASLAGVALYVEDVGTTASQYADAYAAGFLKGFKGVCVADGSSTLADIQDMFAVSKTNGWDKLNVDAQALLTAANANEEGKVVERMAALYDFVYAKYATELATTGNFMNRTITPTNTFAMIENSNTMVIVCVIVSSLVVLSLTGLFLIRRKKHN